MYRVAWIALAGFLLAIVCVGTGAAQEEDVTRVHWGGQYMVGEEALRKFAVQGDPAAVAAQLATYAASPDPRLRALGLALTYEQAARLHVRESDLGGLRMKLMAIAESTTAPGYARDEACRVLLMTPWTGRDAWFEKMLGDLTLQKFTDGMRGYSSLMWILRKPASESFVVDEQAVSRWIPRLISLLARGGAVRGNAAVMLASLCASTSRERSAIPHDVAVALLPWISDPTWAMEDGKWGPGERGSYIASLRTIDLPQAVSGLIHVLETEHGWYPNYAALALVRNHDRRAVPALRAALTHLDPIVDREPFFDALVACGGVPPAEALAALESFARLAARPDGRERILGARMDFDHKIDLSQALGIHVAQGGCDDPAVIAALINRAAALRKTEPEVAGALEAPLFVWSNPAALRHVVSRLRTGDVDPRQWREILHDRRLLAKQCRSELSAMVQAGGTSAGRAAVLLEDDAAMSAILQGSDSGATVSLIDAVLSSDDHTYDPFYGLWVRGGTDAPIHLPVDEIGPLLASPHADVSAAARRWLTHEGGPRAKAWLDAPAGTVPAPVATVTHRYNINGIAPGMTRAQVDALATPRAPKRQVELPYRTPKGPITMDVPAQTVEYSADGRVVLVMGTSLRDGDQLVIAPRTTAGEVRTLLGPPARRTAGHVVFTIGGFFWHYLVGDNRLVLSFTDDSFTKGDNAPLYQVVLYDVAGYERLHPTP